MNAKTNKNAMIHSALLVAVSLAGAQTAAAAARRCRNCLQAKKLAAVWPRPR